MSALRVSRDTAAPAAHSSAWLAVTAVFIAVFMQMLDATIVTVAIPDIVRELGASSAESSLMLTGYTVALACSLLPSARLGMRWGRGGFFTAALAVFVGASVLCGIAPTPLALIAARVLQGAAAGAVSAQPIAIISARFADTGRRNLAFALYGATAGTAAMLGPLVGGLLLGANPLDLSWRSIFLVNLIPGAVALVLAARQLRGSVASERCTVDVGGAILAAIGLFLLVYGLSIGREHSWSTTILAMLAASVAVLAAFVAHERRTAARGGAPLVDPGLFVSARFAYWIVACLVVYGVFAAYLFTMSVSLQFGLGYTALRTGVTTLPFSAGAVAGALIAPKFARALGNRMVGVGCVLFGVLLVGWLLALDPSPAGLSWPVLLVPLLLGGFGVGVAAARLQIAVVAAVPPRSIDSASGLVPTAQQVGNSLGVALIGILFFHSVAAGAPAAVSTERDQLQQRLTAVTPFAPSIAGEFSRCATLQLQSPTPERTPAGCDHSESSQQQGNSALREQVATAVRESLESLAGTVFVSAFRDSILVLLVPVGLASLPFLLRRRKTPIR
ncbi:Spectinomycin tetracycline efflux pump [Nocardia otitidiscaviarum]|uniref:Spectinomycin tetracycline efflux pump n=1 Tax=Nocardia otitidiscaviarum TaxID=1823 RepID=A0A378Y9P3_9NOCA|nr:MFS transporter [Nocardia otitidiscaviarum]SUA73280.1 Spectinomycin tetracycline efflux pump [Nocardia otitidiscaviarum]